MNKTFPASLSILPSMLDFVQQAATSIGFSEFQVSKITLAAEEILVNVINYGYSGVKAGNIDIECSLFEEDGRGLAIVIKDDGIAFNPLANPVNIKFTPESSVEHRKIGGFGILVVLHIMDRVSYRREEGHNVLILKKYFQEPVQYL